MYLRQSKSLVRSPSIAAVEPDSCNHRLGLRDPIQRGLSWTKNHTSWTGKTQLKLITTIIVRNRHGSYCVSYDIFNNKLMTFIELIACSITIEGGCKVIVIVLTIEGNLPLAPDCEGWSWCWSHYCGYRGAYYRWIMVCQMAIAGWSDHNGAMINGDRSMRITIWLVNGWWTRSLWAG